MAAERKAGTAIALTESLRGNDYAHDGEKELKNVDSNIPAKYRGTAADKRDMSILGHKQVLRVTRSKDSYWRMN